MDKLVNIFENLTSLQKILVSVIVVTILYGLSTSVAYSVFTKGLSKGLSLPLTTPLPTPTSDGGEDPNLPRTAECPLNGNMHTEPAKEAWEKKRPLAVMIENHSEARPQSGLSKADVVYEAVAEGGITRFMAMFYCNIGDIQVGPVRSARTYYLDWLGEYDALYAHVGGANTPGPADALSQIIKYGVKDLNQFGIGFPTFWRDYQRLGHPVATEHTMYSTTEKLWAVGAKRGWTNVDEDKVPWDKNFTKWKFKDDQAAGEISSIMVDFWSNQPNYQVTWAYDKNCNCYQRKNGSPHLDLNTKAQLQSKVVIVQFEVERNANDGYPGNIHLLYGTTGKGKALIFEDGKVIEGTWSKASRLSKTKYLDSKGLEIALNRGQIWIQTVPEGSKVSF
ncbi:MAG: DUF3048 domain-containing protein [Candidatus Daviesbacteria bacterium]|nr:MAG: DUF3048 domain-containing protein [Candidatus Daviesbacteria bacterium]